MSVEDNLTEPYIDPGVQEISTALEQIHQAIKSGQEGGVSPEQRLLQLVVFPGARAKERVEQAEALLQEKGINLHVKFGVQTNPDSFRAISNREAKQTIFVSPQTTEHNIVNSSTIKLGGYTLEGIEQDFGERLNNVHLIRWIYDATKGNPEGVHRLVERILNRETLLVEDLDLDSFDRIWGEVLTELLLENEFLNAIVSQDESSNLLKYCYLLRNNFFKRQDVIVKFLNNTSNVIATLKRRGLIVEYRDEEYGTLFSPSTTAMHLAKEYIRLHTN